MAEQREIQQENMDGAVEEINRGAVVLAIESPEQRPEFPLSDMFPTTLEGMVFWQKTLLKYQVLLRETIEDQKEAVKKYVEEQGIPWDEYLKERKADILRIRTLDEDSLGFMEDWKVEYFLPQCHRNVTHMHYTHLCRWTLHHSIEKHYTDNPEVPRLLIHTKRYTSENAPVYEPDSESHEIYVRNQVEQQDFLEKEATFIFNRRGFSVLTQAQILGLEKAMERLLEPRYLDYMRSWIGQALIATQETNLPGFGPVRPTIPQTPHNSFADPSKDTLSDITTLPKDLSPEELSVDQTEDISGIPGLPKDPSIEQSEDPSIDQSEGIAGVLTLPKDTSPDDSLIDQPEDTLMDHPEENGAISALPKDESLEQLPINQAQDMLIEKSKETSGIPLLSKDLSIDQPEDSTIGQSEEDSGIPPLSKQSSGNPPMSKESSIAQPEVSPIIQSTETSGISSLSKESTIDQPKVSPIGKPEESSGFPSLSKESSIESSSIEQSEETGDHTAECTEDEATTPEEDQIQKRKVYSHKPKPKSDDGNMADTE